MGIGFNKKSIDWLPILFVLGLGLAIVLMLVKILSIKGIILFNVAIVAIPVVILCVVNPKIGAMAVLVLSFILLGVKRAVGSIPLGLAMDGLILLLFCGYVLQMLKGRGTKTKLDLPVTLILLWITYNFLEVLNPYAASKMAWLYTIRASAGFMVMYFVYSHVIQTKRDLKLYFYLWILLCLLGGSYGLYQEFVGFLPFEKQWIMSDPRRYGLLFIMGRFRKFSFFSGPMVFGILMSITAVVCFIMAIEHKKIYKKTFFIFSGFIMMLAMVYSGTRAAYVLIPAGFLFYTIIKGNRNIILGMMGIGMLGAVVVLMPSNNSNIIRIQTAFQPGDDASYKVRERNQALIQPFIQSHPMGGGMGSVGVWGERFSPGSFLASFPPDSGFVRIAVEQGWMGLILYCSLIFVFFHVGLKNYYQLIDPTLKALSASLLSALFMLTLANFPQEAIGQLPISLLFFLILALLNKIHYIENNVKKHEIKK